MQPQGSDFIVFINSEGLVVTPKSVSTTVISCIFSLYCFIALFRFGANLGVMERQLLGQQRLINVVDYADDMNLLT